jgi:hypothetical protein
LCGNLGFAEDLARWGVETWAVALGVISDAETTPVATAETATVDGGAHDEEEDIFDEFPRVSSEEILRQTIRRVLADGIVTDAERAEVRRLRRELGIAKDLAARILAEVKAENPQQPSVAPAPPSSAGIEETSYEPDEEDYDDVVLVDEEVPLVAELVESRPPQTVAVVCPNGHRLQIAAGLQGQPSVCPVCGCRFVVPSRHAPAVDAKRQSRPPVTSGRTVSLTVSFAGQWFLLDATVDVRLDGRQMGRGSMKQGFQFGWETTPGTHHLEVKLPIRGAKRYRLDLTAPGEYHAELEYSTTWGNFANECELTFLG